MSNINPLASLKIRGTTKNAKTSKNMNMLKNSRTMQTPLGENIIDMLNTGGENKPSVGVVQIPRKKQFYKTKMCPWFFSGKCDRKDDCLFAHSEEELNPIPDLSFTSLCPSTKKTGICNNENCSYAHSVNELRPTGDLYKTAPCTKFMRGKCAAGAHCRHAHYLEELRPLPGDISPSENAVNLMLSPVFSKMINQNENRRKVTNAVRANTFINKHKNVIDMVNRLNEEKEPTLKQSKTVIGNIAPAGQKSKYKKYVKDVDDEIPSSVNDNYKKSYSIPVQYLPVLFKNYKKNNSSSKVNTNINTNDNMVGVGGEEKFPNFSKATKNALNAHMRSNTSGIKQFMTNKEFNNFYAKNGGNKSEKSDLEGNSDKIATNANIKKIVDMFTNNTYDRSSGVEQNVKTFVNEMLKATREKKNKNYVNKEKNVEALNKHSFFTKKGTSMPKRVSSIPASNKEEFMSNYEDKINLKDTVKQVELSIQENALKTIDETGKVDPANINALLSLLQIQNQNNFDQENFLKSEKSNHEEDVDYEAIDETDMMQMENDESLAFLQQKKQAANNTKGKRLNFSMNMSEILGNKNMQSSTKNKKQNNKMNNNLNGTNNKQNERVSGLQFNNNPLSSCSNFWNFGDDDAAAAAQNMAQMLKVKIIDY